MMISEKKDTIWDLEHLHKHLQAAVSLEFWTIPYYLTVLYSIKDPANSVYQLIQSVVYQEMLHVELAANVANAYGLSPKFDDNTLFPYPYKRGDDKPAIPILDFDLDHPNPTEIKSPYYDYSAELGPLDLQRVNTMCLIEYPDWASPGDPKRDKRENVYEYGSIAEFYHFLAYGAEQLADHIQCHNQVTYFQRFYQNFADQTITSDGAEALPQVKMMLNAITDQGAGKSKGDKVIDFAFQNTADGFNPTWTHFKKFNSIRFSKDWPETYNEVTDLDAQEAQDVAQETLTQTYQTFCHELTRLYRTGEMSPKFGVVMATLGANISNCWKKGRAPKFVAPSPVSAE